MSKTYTSKEFLELSSHPHAVVSVVGCGGKTTFIESLADSCSEEKVLISPTTKIGIPTRTNAPVCTTLEECENHSPIQGIQYMGIVPPNTPHKLTSLPLPVLKEQREKYDISLLEADGSRGLPCKGWLETEPVIPPYTTHTVGIVTLRGLGKPSNEENVLRLPEFLELTGLSMNENITEKALVKMITGKKGLFKNSLGTRVLCMNQIESSKDEMPALQLIWQIKESSPNTLDKVFFGSARKNQWKEG